MLIVLGKTRQRNIDTGLFLDLQTDLTLGKTTIEKNQIRHLLFSFLETVEATG